MNKIISSLSAIKMNFWETVAYINVLDKFLMMGKASKSPLTVPANILSSLKLSGKLLSVLTALKKKETYINGNKRIKRWVMLLEERLAIPENKRVNEKARPSRKGFRLGKKGRFSTPSLRHENDNQDYSVLWKKKLEKKFSNQIQFEVSQIQIVCDGISSSRKKGPGAKIVSHLFFAITYSWVLEKKIETMADLKDAVYSHFSKANKKVFAYHAKKDKSLRNTTATVSIILRFRGKSYLFSFNVGDCETIVVRKNVPLIYMNPPKSYEDDEELVWNAMKFQDSKRLEIRNVREAGGQYGGKTVPSFSLTTVPLQDGDLVITQSDGVGDSFVHGCSSINKCRHIFKDQKWTHDVYQAARVHAVQNGIDVGIRYLGCLSQLASVKKDDASIVGSLIRKGEPSWIHI